MKKVITLSFFLGFANLLGGLLFLQACNPDDGCGEFTRWKVDSVEGDYYHLLSFSGSEYSMQTLRRDEISYDSLAIQLLFDVSSVVQNEQYSFGNMSFACSPLTPVLDLKSMKVTSNAAFDSAHPPGADLSSFFRIGTNSTVSGVPLDKFVNQELPAFTLYLLTFADPPTEVASHVITIEFTNQYNETFSTTMSEVTITQ